MTKTTIYLSFCFFVTGCATMFRGTDQSVFVNTTPTGAKVSFSNGLSCITPCNIVASRSAPLQLTITKEGYQTQSSTLIPTLAGSGAILGGAIDYATGAVYDLQPNPYHTHLYKLGYQ